MDKFSGHKNPEDLPIEVAACDPLDGEMLFGIEDPPDALRTKQNYEQPHAPTLPKKAAATRSKLDQVARQLSERVRGAYGPRFKRYVGRIQAAMQLGVTKQQMLDWFYGGQDTIDPFQVAAAGYAAEARFMATEDAAIDTKLEAEPGSSRYVTEEELLERANKPSDLPEEMQPVNGDGLQEMLDGLEPEHKDEGWFSDTSDVPTPSAMQGVSPEASPLAVAASRSWEDSIPDWLEPIFKRADDQSPFQPGDSIEDDKGTSGKVREVGLDGALTVDFDNGPMTSGTYSADHVQQGIVKRKQDPNAVTPPNQQTGLPTQ